jgi:DNA polymerase-3 subunit beta
MRFSASIQELASALGKVSGVVPPRSPMQVLENLHLELSGSELTLTATDMDITMSTKLSVKGEKDGSILVPAKRFTDTVRALPGGEMTFDADLDSWRVSISVPSGEFKLTGLSPDEYPKLVNFEGTVSMTLPKEKFAGMIDRTSFACSTDEFRPAMTGVLFQFRKEEIRSVATDGFRLVRVIDQETPVDVSEDLDIIVPPKALQLAAKGLESESITLSASETHVRFEDENTTITARLIDEKYPNYESVIPQSNDKRMVVRREDILNMVKRVSLYSNAQTRQVRMKMGDNALEIAAQDTDTGGEAHEGMACDYGSEELEIGFNAQFMREALDRIDTDEVTFDFSTPLRPSLISPHGGSNGQDVLMLLMPIRLNN